MTDLATIIALTAIIYILHLQRKSLDCHTETLVRVYEIARKHEERIAQLEYQIDYYRTQVHTE